jgi:hypothetical protein
MQELFLLATLHSKNQYYCTTICFTWLSLDQ